MGKKSKKEVEDIGELNAPNGKKEGESTNTINIDEIDAQAESQTTLSILFSVIKNISIGTDLTNVTIPGALILPKSSLEYLPDYFALHFDILLKANEIQDNKLRFLEVYKYILTIAPLPKDMTRKPLNPVLGETCNGQVVFDAPNNNNLNLSNQEIGGSKGILNSCQFFCEQISHHPPIAKSVIYNKEAGIYIDILTNFKPTFHGTYVNISLNDKVLIRFDKFNETYTTSSPLMVARIIRRFVELSDTHKMTVSSSKLRAKTTFHPKPLLYGSYNTMDAVIYNDKEKILKVKGQWTDKLKISDYKKDDYKPFLDKSVLKEGVLNFPTEKLPTDSRLVWKGLFDESDKGSPAKVITREKTKVEEEQRKLAAERKKKGEIWTSQYFNKEKDGSYKYNRF